MAALSIVLAFAFVPVSASIALAAPPNEARAWPNVPGVAVVTVDTAAARATGSSAIDVDAPFAARSLGLWWREHGARASVERDSHAHELAHALDGTLVELLDARGRTLALEPLVRNDDFDARWTGIDRPARDLAVSGLVHAQAGVATSARLWLPPQAELDELVAVWIAPPSDGETASESGAASDARPRAKPSSTTRDELDRERDEPSSSSDAPPEGTYPKPSVYNRASWGALSPTCSSGYCSVTHIAIHHSASTADYASTSLATCKANVKAIQQYHMVTNGWCDIGYNYLVCKHGDLFEGRAGGDDVNGAHDSCNCGSMGVCSMGYHHAPYNNAVTSATLASLGELGAWKCAQKNINPLGTAYYAACGSTESTIYGHRDVSSTACPGDLLYAQLGALKSSIQAKLNGSGGCAAGEIKDCNGHCCPASWVGDGYCDNGAYAWNGFAIYLNCAAFGNDGGDCGASGGGTLKGVLYNAALGTGAPIGGGTVALANGSFVVTAANGYYEFALPAGTYALAATAPGFGFAQSSETVTSGEVWESLGLNATSAIPQHRVTPLSSTSFNATFQGDVGSPVYLVYAGAPGIPLSNQGALGYAWPSLAALQVLALGNVPGSGTLSINLQVTGAPSGLKLHMQGYLLKAGSAKLTNGSAFQVP